MILVADWLLGILFLHETVVGSLYGASRVVATVGPGADEEGSPQWYPVVSSLLMLAAIALAAVFTAGVVNRLLSRRTIALVGRRTLPLEDHVVVVGLGQVGLRLAATLSRSTYPRWSSSGNRPGEPGDGEGGEDPGPRPAGGTSRP